MHFVSRFIIFIYASLLSCNQLVSQEILPPFDQDDSKAELPVIESIVVTGSLVPRGDFVSNAPIATISSDQFEMSNSVNVESLVNSMPQVIGGADRSSTWGEGIATANLRGLGENRTLVLVNGRRFVPSFPDGGTVDLNFIPVGLIDRVEVLTGGASAAYGSDALAGVINFILREETDGWEFNVGTEMSEKGDAEISNFNITNGGSFASGRGQYMVHFDMLERKPLLFTDRSLSREPLDEAQDANGNFLFDDSGELYLSPSENRFEHMWYCPRGSLQTSWSESPWYSVVSENGDLIPLSWEVDCLGNNNINSLQYLQLPQERNSFKGKLSYDFERVQIYADVYYSTSDVPMALPTSPITSWPSGTVFKTSVQDSPFFSQSAQETISNFYINEWGDPQWYSDDDGNGIVDTADLYSVWKSFENEIGMSTIDREFDSVQIEFGLKGEISSSWGYEIFAQLGEVKSNVDPNPLLSFERLSQGLIVNSQGECVDQSGGCVPVNIFAYDIGQAALDFVRYPTGAGKSISKTEQAVYMATLSGNTDWISLPGDPGPLGIVLGFEYLEIKSEINTPNFIENLNYIGYADLPRSLEAAIDNVSVFGELLVPLISDQPGISFLEMEMGFRLSDHSVAGESSTFKLALSYYPTDDWQVRVSYNKAIRSPSIDELYKETNRINQNGYLWDPCTSPIEWGDDYVYVGDWEDDAWIERSAELAALCIATGVPSENIYNYDFMPYADTPLNAGGNLGINPEKGTTISYGFIWTPYDIDNLSISLDYYQVEIADYIETSPVTSGGRMLVGCYDPSQGIGGAGSASCDALIRDSNGRLTSVFTGYRNLGLHELKGWDANISYGFELFGGYLDFDYFASKLTERTIADDSFGDTHYTCLGTFNDSCNLILDFPVMDYKHRATANWSNENIQVQLVWKHISSITDGDESQVYFTEKLDSYSTIDLSLQYSFFQNIVMTGGVKNLFNKQPQAMGMNDINYYNRTGENVFQLGSSNTIPQYYDMFGRTFFLKLSSTF